MTLYELLETGYGKDEDLNCAEKMLYGANEAYDLGLDKNALRLAAGFGGGMGIESVCGALTGAIMVLGRLFVEENAHESTRIKELSSELLRRYDHEMEYIDCDSLKKSYRTEQTKCDRIILKAAEILDELIARELAK